MFSIFQAFILKHFSFLIGEIHVQEKDLKYLLPCLHEIFLKLLIRVLSSSADNSPKFEIVVAYWKILIYKILEHDSNLIKTV